MLSSNIGVNSEGRLTFAGFDTTRLAEEYGTPVYLLDETRLRHNCRMYVASMSSAFGAGSIPLYAGKALCFSGLFPIIDSEGMGADVVSGGELFTALRAGFPPEKLFFHGNSKTDDEIRMGVDAGIGYFVVDNSDELAALSAYARKRGRRQRILLRVTPGIDPHTFAAVNTGRLDCQFGSPIETGQALSLAGEALSASGVELCGFHCHIGSQIFNWEHFRDAADIMLGLLEKVRITLGYTAEILNLGGGFGVRYLDSDPVVDVPAIISRLGAHLRERCAAAGYPMPRIHMEPGRSIVADAGMTLYRVCSVKTIDGYRSYVCVDGGMTDNPRYALYDAPYTVYSADHAAEPADFLCTIAGRCCESGALIQENVRIPRPVRGGLLAVATTGAYNFSMASNYNRVGRPPVIMLGENGVRVAVRRETREDMCSRDA